MNGPAAMRRVHEPARRAWLEFYGCWICAVKGGYPIRNTEDMLYCAVNPPSIGRVTPVVNEFSGAPSQTTACATSSERPKRPMG